MLPEYQKKSNIGVGIGLVMEIGGQVMLKSMAASGGLAGAFVGLGVMLVGAGFFIWGCCAYAQAKGHSGLYGLLGLLSVIGLLILLVLPDRCKEAV
jgi:hypothetical protein